MSVHIFRDRSERDQSDQPVIRPPQQIVMDALWDHHDGKPVDEDKMREARFRLMQIPRSSSSWNYGEPRFENTLS